MSHVVGIDLKIKSIDAVKRACKELGLTFKEGQKTFKWFGRWVNDYDAKDAAYKLGIKPEDYGKCEHAIQVPGTNWEIGLIKKDDGYVMAFDFWGSQGKPISDAIGGNEGHKFQQYYAANVAEIEMEKDGYETQREWLDDGSLNIHITSGGSFE